MRIEYWATVRRHADSYYVTIPKAEAYKLIKHSTRAANDPRGPLVGKECKVEVTL